MSKIQKFLEVLLRGTSDNNILFDDMRSLLLRLGFSERINGSHHIYNREGVDVGLNIQPDSHGKMKPYQVRQVRKVVLKYNLDGEV
ncbi:MAG TPA: type II toxin-antitoxin system HicA family toxin [Candidatus Kapabacteria bacterium]|jgi:hypothetical protein